LFLVVAVELYVEGLFVVCALRIPFVAIHLDSQVEALPVHHYHWKRTDCDADVYFVVPLLVWKELT
jgi:hypothetical protein